MRGRTTLVIAHRLSTIQNAAQDPGPAGRPDRRVRHARRTAAAGRPVRRSFTENAVCEPGRRTATLVRRRRRPRPDARLLKQSVMKFRLVSFLVYMARPPRWRGPCACAWSARSACRACSGRAGRHPRHLARADVHADHALSRAGYWAIISTSRDGEYQRPHLPAVRLQHRARLDVGARRGAGGADDDQAPEGRARRWPSRRTARAGRATRSSPARSFMAQKSGCPIIPAGISACAAPTDARLGPVSDPAAVRPRRTGFTANRSTFPPTPKAKKSSSLWAERVGAAINALEDRGGAAWSAADGTTSARGSRPGAMASRLEARPDCDDYAQTSSPSRAGPACRRTAARLSARLRRAVRRRAWKPILAAERWACAGGRGCRCLSSASAT